MLLLKLFLIYLIIGAAYFIRAILIVLKDEPNGHKVTIRMWNRMTLWDKFVVLTRLFMKWPEYVGLDIIEAIRKRRLKRIEEELERRKKEP